MGCYEASFVFTGIFRPPVLMPIYRYNVLGILYKRTHFAICLHLLLRSVVKLIARYI